MPSKRLTTHTMWVRFPFRINYMMVRYVWTQNQSFAPPTTSLRFPLVWLFWGSKSWYTLWLKGLSYKFHLCGFPPVWAAQRSVEAEHALEALPDFFHWYGFYTVWILWLIIRPELWLKALLHSLHLHWNVSHHCCLCNVFLHYELSDFLDGHFKHCPHTWHFYAVYPVWTAQWWG